ncbi:MAG: hypothetical protein ACI4AL_04900 [Aristaeellaceae bacterium]
MKLKKIALRGLIGVAVVVALCMFFSGTIENITTPKVKLAKASRGKLVEKLELNGVLAYPEVEEMRLGLPAGQTLTISRVNVRAGYPVKAGDVVLEASVTGYEAAAKQAQDEYDAALDALMEIDRKNEGLTLRRSEQTYADTYAALREAARQTARKKTEMEVLLRAAKLGYTDAGYPDGADEATVAAIDAYRAALSAQDEAQTAFNRAARYGVDDAVWSYISERQAAQEKLTDCAEKQVELEELRRAAATICAPRDGVIAEINLKQGDPYDGSMPLYKLTAEGSSPALRADLSGVDKSITEGMGVTVSVGGDSVDAKIASLGFTESGARCADVIVNDEILRAAGSMYALSQDSVKLTVLFKSKQSSCLLPASAVRGSGDSRYVYTVNERTTTFGKKKLSLSKMSVHVIAEADGVASIEEDLSYYTIAYMEDRALRDGSDVMEYVE